MNEADDKIVTKCGATSSYCPDFGQIPMDALIRLAKRYENGEAKHGRDNWRKGLGDPSYVIGRLNHAIYHSLKLINKLEGKVEWNGDDDAGAIMWAGAFAVEALKVLQPELQFD